MHLIVKIYLFVDYYTPQLIEKKYLVLAGTTERGPSKHECREPKAEGDAQPCQQ